MHVKYPLNVSEITEELKHDELVKRLKVCVDSLQSMAQDSTFAQQYRPLAMHFASEFFFEYQSRDVKVLVACCIADLLRISAPDAPYNDVETLKQLKGLDQPSSALYTRYFYLLENLSCVRTLTIIFDLAESDQEQIMIDLFRLMFHIIENGASDKIRPFVLDLLSPLISDNDSISLRLFDCIFMNIIEPYKTQNRDAYKLASQLIEREHSKMEPYVQNFLNGILLLGHSEFESSEHIYDVIYELYQISPSLLYAVLPQMEVKLQSSDVTERLHCTRMLAKLFGDKRSNAAESHPNLWLCFLKRFNDTDSQVRSRCIKASIDFLQYHEKLRDQVSSSLLNRAHDKDENVRYEVVQAISCAAKYSLDSVTDSLLDCVKDRTLDTKFKVRKEALASLGTLYRKEMLSDETSATHKERLDWVKNKILHMYYQQTMEDRLYCEKLLHTCLVPYMTDVTQRMTMLHMLYITIDDHAVRAFNEIMRQQFCVRCHVKQILEYVRQPESSERDQLLTTRLRQLSECFVDSLKSLDYLRQFCEFIKKDDRVFKIMNLIVANSYTCKKVEDLVKELLMKVGNSSPMYDIVKCLLERASPIMVDSHALCVLMERVALCLEGFCSELSDQPEDHVIFRSFELLEVLSCSFPMCFRTSENLQMLAKFLSSEDSKAVDITLKIIANVHINQADVDASFSELLRPTLVNLTCNGTYQQAKHSIKCLHLLFPNDITEIIEDIFDDLKDKLVSNESSAIAALSSLGMIALLQYDRFHKQLRSILTNVVVKKIILTDEGYKCDHVLTNHWLNKAQLPLSTLIKSSALKFMTRFVLGVNKDSDAAVNKIVKILLAVIEQKGDIMNTGNLCAAECAYFRLTAAKALIKIIQERKYRNILAVDEYHLLGYVIVDEFVNVRDEFVKKLHKALYNFKLPLEYLAYTCLPSLLKQTSSKAEMSRFRAHIQSVIKMNSARRRDMMRRSRDIQSRPGEFMPEYSLSYAVHLLAHHPALKSFDDVRTLRILRECIWFLMEPIVSAPNQDYGSLAFLYKMFQDIKQTHDALEPSSEMTSKKLWVLCDIGMALVAYRCNNFQLRNLPAKSVLNIRFFVDPILDRNNTELFVPFEILDEEKLRKSKTVHDAKLQKILYDSPLPKKQITTAAASKGSRRKRTTVSRGGGTIRVNKKAKTAEPQRPSTITAGKVEEEVAEDAKAMPIAATVNHDVSHNKSPLTKSAVTRKRQNIIQKELENCAEFNSQGSAAESTSPRSLKSTSPRPAVESSPRSLKSTPPRSAVESSPMSLKSTPPRSAVESSPRSAFKAPKAQTRSTLKTTLRRLPLDVESNSPRSAVKRAKVSVAGGPAKRGKVSVAADMDTNAAKRRNSNKISEAVAVKAGGRKR